MGFISEAYKGDNTAWKVWFTAFVCTGMFIGNFIAFLITPASEWQRLYEQLKLIPSAMSLFLNLLPFVILLGLLFFLVRYFHHRSIRSLTTSRPKVDVARIWFSFGLILAVSLLGFGISYATDSTHIVWNFNVGPFLILLAISLLMFPFQIGLEEYLFRGFLMQQIGVALKNRWAPLVVTSVLFGVFHSANPEVAAMGWGVMAFYIGTGLLLGIMTLMDEGLELALGFHLGNNLVAALLLTSEFSALQTDALFKYTASANTQGLLAEMLFTIALTYPLLLFILSKKYKWTHWNARLFGKVPSAKNLSS